MVVFSARVMFVRKASCACSLPSYQGAQLLPFMPRLSEPPRRSPYGRATFVLAWAFFLKKCLCTRRACV